MTTRRKILLAGIASMPLFAADPWTKKSSEWSDKDIQKLMTRSPWAKEASMEFNMDGMEGGGPPDGGPPPGGGPDGGPPGGMPDFHALVRWESALPIRLAKKNDSGKDEARYILSVSGLPMMGRPGGPGPDGEGQPQRRRNPAAMLERMKTQTKLERKGKDPIYPDKVERREDPDDPAILLYFSAASQPIELPDKEVTFTSRLGPFELKVKFALKDMVYQGKLEL